MSQGNLLLFVVGAMADMILWFSDACVRELCCWVVKIVALLPEI